MAIKITLKNSVVQDSVPTTTHLAAVGELALNANINSLGIYMRASDNTIVKMAGPGSLTTPAASTTAAGISEYATNTETTTGTATDRTVTPAGLAAVTSAERSTSNSTYLALAGGTLAGVLQATAGSNSAPAIHFGDSDSGIYGGTNTVSLAAGGTQGLTLNSDAYVTVPTRLSIGGVGPSDDLHIQTSSPSIRFVDTDATGGYAVIGVNNTSGSLTFKSDDTDALTNSYMSFEVDGSESARVDASGRLLVGLTSARTLNSGYTPSLQVEGNTATTSSISAINNVNQTGGPSVWLGKSRGAALGGVTTVQSGDELGSIFFNGADGTDIQSIGASIVAKSNGTVAGNRMPGSLVFGTTADSAGSVAPTTRLTITSAGLVNVPDNGKFTAGASDDLQIYHDGTDSIFNDTRNSGTLRIQADSIGFNDKDVSETMLLATADGSVDLYFNGSKKLETTSTGATVTGELALSSNGSLIKENQVKFSPSGAAYIDHFTVDQDIIFRTSDASALDTTALTIDASDAGTAIFNHDVKVPDHGKFIAGAGEDLQIYHDGTNSYLLNQIGNLEFYINSSEVGAKIIPNGAVELYYDGTKKLESASYGAVVTGTFQATGNIELFDNGTLNVGTGADLKIYHDGSNSHIKDITDYLFIYGNNGVVIKTNSSGTEENQIRCINNGSVELFHNNTKTFSTSANASIVWGGEGENCTLFFHADEGDDWADYWNITATTAGQLDFQYRNDSGGFEDSITLTRNGAVELYYDNVKQCETNSGGMNWADSKRAYFGNSSDLQMYHDGTNSWIDNTTGALYLKTAASNSVYILDNNNDTLLSATDDAGIVLCWDNSTRFETTSTGVKVTGDLVPEANATRALGTGSLRWAGAHITALRIYTDGQWYDNAKATFGHGEDLQIYHDGSNSYIKDAGTGSLVVLTTHFNVANAAGSEEIIKAYENGAVELYHNGLLSYATATYGGNVQSDSTSVYTKYKTSEGSTRGYLYANNTDTMGFLTSSGTWRFQVENDGDYTFYGSNVSDRDRKDNITTITGTSLDKITKLVPKTYNWKATADGKTPTDRTFTGFIAQEVKEHLPSLVNGTDGQKNMSVDYNGILAHAVKAITELSAEVETLKTKVAALEGA